MGKAKYGVLSKLSESILKRKEGLQHRMKHVSWKDERPDEVISKSPELIDPAILAIGEGVRHRYSRDELMKLRAVPMSMTVPTYLEEIVPSIYDPDRNSTDRKKSNSPTENHQPEPRGRKPGDPRERVRKENDGIVLSPQRRSFNSGCAVSFKEQQAPPAAPQMGRAARAHSPLGKGEHAPPAREVAAQQQQQQRRIGSGRIVRDAWDGDADEHAPAYARRAFGYDAKEPRRNGARYVERARRPRDDRDEEPEWFSGGPVSQNDTIELRGFDDGDKLPPSAAGKKKLSASQAKRVREWAKRKSEGGANSLDREQPAPAQQGDAAGEDKENRKNALGAAGDVINENSFIFDDLFKCDSISGLLANGGNGDGDSKSRFSRWFKHDSPESKQQQQSDSRRSSLHEDHHLLKNLLNDLNEPAALSIPQAQGPGDAESYFAPISPAAPNHAAVPHARQIDIAEIFKRGQPNAANFNKFPGKVMSLNELESRIRKGVDVPPMQPPKNPMKPDDEMTAFKRLLAQVSGGHVVTANNAPTMPPQRPPMSLMEMLSHSQQQDEARLNQHLQQQQQQQQPAKGTTLGAQQFKDLALKMQQALHPQQPYAQQVNKLLGMQQPQQLRSSPLADLNQQQCKELLNRPEAQAILHGMKRGDITAQHLYQQLANPGLQPRHRDLLGAILQLHGFGPSPRSVSPAPPQPPQTRVAAMFAQQALRVSPLPNAIHQRIPSPRELQVHTQNILQRALIKKKLEEQQENYRKKQEMQRGQSPSKTSPTPLAFTPTSVLRKMTAEKEDGNKDAKNVELKVPPQGRAVTGVRMPTSNQWAAQFQIKQPAGRPIVKANAGYQNAEQFFSSAAQQQHLFNQQRLPPMQQPPPQQPKQLGMQYSGGGQQYPQLTQQQLRARHQQQAPPAQAGNAWQQFLSAAQAAPPSRADKGSPSSTSDQFARWFSPDLLERARGGELPSTAGLAQHAVSLEEIERQAAPPPVHN